MNSLKKAAIIATLIDTMRQKGSWCGETHLQKATYLLQELLNVPLDFNFILYKHGPFSFDLRDELTALRANEMIKLEPQALPYGPRINSTKMGKKIQNNYPKTIKKYKKHIQFIADNIDARGVLDLEKLATALYVTLQMGRESDIEERVDELRGLKPYFSSSEASSAFEMVDQMIDDSREIVK